MKRSSLAFVLGTAVFTSVIAGVARPVPVGAQTALSLEGRWTLNRAGSQIPKEVGFTADGLSLDPTTGAPTGGGGGGGGRGRRSSGGGGVGRVSAMPTRPESADDVQRARLLMAEIRNPAAQLTIAETPTAIAITDDRGQVRTFHPNGKEEIFELGGAPVGATAKNEADRLSVVYSVEEGRTVRYIYHHTDAPNELIVEVDLLGRGGGDKATFVYTPWSPTDVVTAPVPASAPASAAGSGSVPNLLNTPFNQKPGAELRGLTSVGLVVEDLSSEAIACGLNQSTLETTVSKRLSDAGFKVLKNSDEDTYVYVHIVTTNPSSSLCVSSYDVFFYSHVTARLSYQQTPVLLQVSLLNNGGLAGGPPSTHGAAVLRGVQDYVDQFVGQIRAANK